MEVGTEEMALVKNVGDIPTNADRTDVVKCPPTIVDRVGRVHIHVLDGPVNVRFVTNLGTDVPMSSRKLTVRCSGTESSPHTSSPHLYIFFPHSVSRISCRISRAGPSYTGTICSSMTEIMCEDLRKEMRVRDSFAWR